MNETRTEGASTLTLLFFIFLILKLVGVVTWSWWWILAPLWGPMALVIVIVIFIAVMD